MSRHPPHNKRRLFVTPPLPPPPQQQQQQKRTISLTSVLSTAGPVVPEDAPTIPITFINPHPAKSRLKQVDPAEDSITVDARIGETLLQTAHRFQIDLEGACEGVCACSTCHLIFSNDVYDQLPEPSEDEEDMLDMAFGLTSTSRLGCQVIVEECMSGMKVTLPAATRNFYVDGHVPQPH
jgi:ferredoxin-2, mitochondrial